VSEPLPLPGFADGKDPAALRTIGEVAAGFDIRQHVLRYWEQQFPMLRPLKRSGGRRYYRPEDIALVETINRLINQEGYTLKGARQAIERGLVAGQAGSPATLSPVASTPVEAQPPADVPDAALLAQLRAIRARLANALA
jgi:DNA-binding transcriptional MerR regulator